MDYVYTAFTTAKLTDTGSKMFYNDYNIHGDTPKFGFVLAMLAELKQKQIPVDGVGLQMHISDNSPYDGTNFSAVLKQFSEVVDEIQITSVQLDPNSKVFAGM